MGFFTKLLEGSERRAEERGGVQAASVTSLNELRMVLPESHAEVWNRHGGRRYMLNLENYFVSEVLEGELELGRERLNGRLEVRRGKGAIALGQLFFTWVSAQMGTATQNGGGGFNGQVGGRRITEVAKFDSDVVAVMWREDDGRRGQLAIRTAEQDALYETVRTWVEGAPARMQEWLDDDDDDHDVDDDDDDDDDDDWDEDDEE